MTAFPTSTIPPYREEQPLHPMPPKDRLLLSLFICALAGFTSYHLLPRKVKKTGSSVVLISTWMLRHSIQNFLKRCVESLASQPPSADFCTHLSERSCHRDHTPPIILLNNSHRTTPPQPSSSQAADRGTRQGRREGQMGRGAEGSPPPSQRNVGDRGDRQERRSDQTDLSPERSSCRSPFPRQMPTEHTFSHAACPDTRQEKRTPETSSNTEDPTMNRWLPGRQEKRR